MHRYLIGTLFEEEELNKKMNINSVKAKDPFGNTRWKGAFTGGFQAGFKNTCGSKDGWTPSTFVSSVFNRADKKDQNILDYMDKEDLGREAIGENLSLRQGFNRSAVNPFNISTTQSIGEKMLSKMKKKQAFLSAPQDIKQLHKLLQNYEREEEVHAQNYNAHILKGTDNYHSVGTQDRPPNDDFIVAYEDFFKKVIRASIRQETQQDRNKRIQENKIYFDFSKPLDEQPDYLKEIHEIEQHAQPKKRRRNVIHDHKLRSLFKMAKVEHIMETDKKINYDVPEDYDPYHRLKDLKEKDKKLITASQEKPKHKIHSINKRSDLLGQGNIGSRFVSASSTISSNKFVRAGQQSNSSALEKVFEDEKKNQRYWDYVMEIEGKKISAQLDDLDYQQAERQKQQFEKTYKLKGLSQTNKKSSNTYMPKKVQQALKAEKRQVKVIRTTGVWKPQRLLCKRFGCVLPYREQNKNEKSQQKYF